MRIVTGIVAAAMGVALLIGPTAQAASAASDRGGLGGSSGLGPSSGIGGGKGYSRSNAGRFGG
ncbi:hypothetical protein ACIHFD_58440 [Nonomuraea sp. NPDC051941]|uniref:hypothetical protein n=1 Tax=Nonomuraea sp. NPDC051941 TaxID=3364373 RepID=UPI0037C8B676